MAPAARGGVVVRHEGALRFLPASVVTGITPCPPISRVPGAPKALVGIVHTRGEIVPVVAMDGARSSPLVVCRYLGEPVGLLGCDIVRTGLFDGEPDGEGVVVDGEAARPLDLAATFAELVRARWMALGGIDG